LIRSFITPVPSSVCAQTRRFKHSVEHKRSIFTSDGTVLLYLGRDEAAATNHRLVLSVEAVVLMRRYWAGMECAGAGRGAELQRPPTQRH
jgi:hypothetical protein